MRSVDRLMDEQRRKNRRFAQRQNSNLEDGPDEVDILMELPATAPLNTAPGVFDRDVQKRFGGINTAPSAFDRGTIFKVSGAGEEDQ